MAVTYKAVFNVKNLGEYKRIPGLENAIVREYTRVYNIYADKTNAGITEKLNEEFAKLYPNYFEDNQGREWYGLTEYNRFMADGYQRLIVDELNNTKASLILEFFVDPEEVTFKGRLKMKRDVTVEFYLEQIVELV